MEVRLVEGRELLHSVGRRWYGTHSRRIRPQIRATRCLDPPRLANAYVYRSERAKRSLVRVQCRPPIRCDRDRITDAILLGAPTFRAQRSRGNVVFPTVFLAGVFFPVDSVPLWMEEASKANPVTYGVDAIRHIFLGSEPAGAGLGVTASATR